LEASAGQRSPSKEQRLLLVACADRIADALEHLALGEAARKAQVEAEIEQNRNALLSAVSHDMKTPLAAILTAGTTLLGSARRERGSAPELLETIVQESERLNGMIANLLSATRLESGKAILNKQLEALDDLIAGVLSRLSGRLTDRELIVDVPDDLPLLEVDPVLLDQLLVNQLENVLRYTPGSSPIELRVRSSENTMLLEVCDRGPGVAEADREKVFEKFFRGQAASRNDGGTGLGLTICRAIAHAHGGSVTLHGRRGGGCILRTALPLSQPNRSTPLLDERRPQA
jgi:two-component system sensor histidine kinase KdpD